jgi:hypothetical protein
VSKRGCSHSARGVFLSLSCVDSLESHLSYCTILISLMAGQELAAAVVNDANKTKRSNPVPGRVDTEDNNNERDSSCISTDLIHQPANNEVTGDVQSARRRKEKPLASRRDDMKATFEAQRKKVLDRVPEDYKNMFGQAGFIGWGQAVLPALIVSPYSVPRGIGSPREKWLKMLDIVSAVVLVRNRFT